MYSTKVAVVTGGNKGIGFAIVKGLCEKFNGKVYLTARDESRGIAAVNKLKEMGLNPVYYQLDICDQASITKLREHIEEIDGGIDILINNAAISYLVRPTVPLDEQAENVIHVNYFGTLHVCETLFPILRPNAQVINITSSCGQLLHIPSPALRSKFKDPNLTISQLSDLMNQYVTDVKEGKLEELGWGVKPYFASKIGVSAVTILQQNNFDNEGHKRNIAVNSVHPGVVATDMNGYKGNFSIEEGACAPLYLALKVHGWKGKFVWHDCTVRDWCNSRTI